MLAEVKINNTNDYDISLALNLVQHDNSKCAHTPTHSHPHPHTRVYYAQSTTLTHLKQILSRGPNNGGKQQRERRKHGSLLFWKKRNV